MDLAEATGGKRPFVVAHVAVSVDGATTGFDPDMACFYELAARWREDATLTGADTVLAQEEALQGSAGPGPTPGAPLLAVVDGRARVRQWAALREAGHWSRVLALRCALTAAQGVPAGAQEKIVGGDRVDLDLALRDLRTDEGVAVVRVDSGGSLTGALLQRGLLDEVSLLVHPVFLGAASRKRWWGAADTAPRPLTLSAADRQGGLMWLRYRTGPLPVEKP
jgi:2,5-diamino-6-(ribosylamino)-4(3H)-pyrimidinone 5'-phosphate reductase